MSNINMTIDEVNDKPVNNELNIDFDISEEELDNIFNNYLQEYYDPNKFWNDIKSQNKPTGIDIKKSENEYLINPFQSKLNNERVIFNNNETISLDTIEFIKTLDLDITKYSLEDILYLFNLSCLQGETLTEEKMKQAKKLMLKAHPDKSRLEPKYFLFLMKAYKHLNYIYTLQNKVNNDINVFNEVKNDDNPELCKRHDLFFLNDDPFFVEYENEQKKSNNVKTDELQNPFSNFYDWLQKTEKINLWLEWRDLKFLENSNKNGYGEWLKSNDGLYEEPKPRPDKIDEKWNNEFEKMRQNVNALAVYNNINKVTSNDTRGSALIDTTNNFTKSTIFNDNMSKLGYTDIKEAFTECIIPINPSEMNISGKTPQCTNYNEILSLSDMSSQVNNETNIDDNLRNLYYTNLHTDNISENEYPLISTALEFHYASKKFNNSFKN